MGNYRFKPANMMPNTWFYRLKDMSGTRNQSSNSVSSKKKQFPAATTATQPSKPKQPHQSYPRKSYYYTRECHPKEQEIHNSPAKPKATVTHFPHSPRTSSRQRVNRKSKVDSPKLVSARCNCPATAWTKSDSPPDYSASLSDSSSEPDSCYSFPPEFRSDNVLTTKSFDKIMSLSGSYNCKLNYNAEDDAINVAKRSLERKFDKLAVFDNMSNLDLPPIITKQVKFDEKVKNITKKETSKEANKNRKSLAAYAEANAQRSLSLNIDEKEGLDTKARKKRLSVRRHSVTSPGVRLRVNSPRLASRRRVQGYGQKSVLMSSSSSYSSRRSLSNSLAIVKFSLDPQRDFRDSMVDMIVENNISSSKDLEDLLACYLSLNSDEYHDLIIKVFKQIWLDLTHFQQK